MKRMDLDWSIRPDSRDFKLPLRRFEKYLRNIGLRESTIVSYLNRVDNFLEFAGNDKPHADAIEDYRDFLRGKHLSISTINNCSFAIRSYYKMLGEDVSFKFVNPNNILPCYFSEDDVLHIFDVCTNLKHLAMLQVLFYGCLRASELCNLDDMDVDLKSLTIHIRDGKGGKDGLTYIQDDCARTLRQYLAVRPPLKIDGRPPLFYTDYGKRWDRKELYRMFMSYKRKAGIEKKGGLHVFSRHTTATILIAKGCDIRIVQELLRHNDIRTTLRYAHVSDKTKRESYEKYLII